MTFCNVTRGVVKSLINWPLPRGYLHAGSLGRILVVVSGRCIEVKNKSECMDRPPRLKKVAVVERWLL